MVDAKTRSPYLSAAISATTSGANTLVAGIPGKTIRVYRIMFTLAAGTVIFKDSAIALSGAMTLTALYMEDPSGDPLYVTTDGNDFVATLSGTNQMSGTIWYQQS